jgi:N6-adenosine-specific RNA methylase IME4
MDEEYESFRAEIAASGILVPLDVTAEGVVLDGRQRLRAARELALRSVPARVVAPADPLEYMLRAALFRRNLNPSQQAVLGLELGEYRAARAEGERRRLANLKGSPEVANLPPRGERSREVAARIVGVSPRSIQTALGLRESDPLLFEEVKAGRMRLNEAAQHVKRARLQAEARPAPALPAGPFDITYADPAWQLGNPNGARAPENHYLTMPLAEILALSPPVAENSLLFLWAVNMLLPEALQVMAAWGFTYVTNQPWVKPSIGLGNWARNRHELLLWGKRGSFPAPAPQDRPDSVIEAPRGRHSEKPECVCEQIERMYPGASKLELFARRRRPGWTAWGNEVPQ